MVCCVHVGVIVCFTHHFRRENHSMISIYSKKRAKFLWLPHGGDGFTHQPTQQIPPVQGSGVG